MSTTPEIIIAPAWKRDDPRIEADAIRFWQAEGILPSGLDPAERAKELVAAAYIEDEAVGMLTAKITPREPQGHCYAFYRVAVAQAWRQQHVSHTITWDSLNILADWSKAHPEVGLAGMLTTYEAPEYRVRKTKGKSNNIGLVLIRYNEVGDEVRVRWFDHLRV